MLELIFLAIKDLEEGDFFYYIYIFWLWDGREKNIMDGRETHQHTKQTIKSLNSSYG
jgi:hypothetical protein